MSQETVFYSRVWPLFEFSDNPYFLARDWEKTSQRLLDLVAAMYLLSDGKQSKKAMCLQGDLLFLTQIAKIREVIG